MSWLGILHQRKKKERETDCVLYGSEELPRLSTSRNKKFLLRSSFHNFLYHCAIAKCEENFLILQRDNWENEKL